MMMTHSQSYVLLWMIVGTIKEEAEEVKTAIDELKYKNSGNLFYTRP
jgi:hypothetical protein